MLRTTFEEVEPELASAPSTLALLHRSPQFVPKVQRLAKMFRAITDIRLAEIGLISGQDQLLAALPKVGTITVSSAAQALCIRPSTVSKMVDRLIEKGLVLRLVDPNDARSTHVSLTERGVEKKAEVQKVWLALEDELASGSEDVETRRMQVLDELEAQVGKRLARLR